MVLLNAALLHLLRPWQCLNEGKKQFELYIEPLDKKPKDACKELLQFLEAKYGTYDEASYTCRKQILPSISS